MGNGMTPLLIAGLAVIAVGIFAWAISVPLARYGARSRAYLQPGLDQQREQRRSVIWIRSVGSLQALFGLGIVIYWALGGGR
jgi:hypothetical protein